MSEEKERNDFIWYSRVLATKPSDLITILQHQDKKIEKFEQQLQAAKEENEKLLKEKARMQISLDKIRDIELESLDVDWDEYKAECGTTDFSAIVTNCEIGLGETEE